MKNVVFFLLFLLISGNVFPQVHFYTECRRSFKTSSSHLPPPSIYTNRVALGKIASSTFELVKSDNFPTEASPALDRAKTIWSYLITSNKPIKIKVKWENQGDAGLLASTHATLYFKRQFLGTEYYYPIALAEHLSSSNLNHIDSCEMEITFNSTQPWYYGVDGNTPSNKVDLASTAMHEITHGLGFASSVWAGKEHNVYFGHFGTNDKMDTIRTGSPTIYDYYLGQDDSPLNKLCQENLRNTVALGTMATDSMGVVFYGPNAYAANNDVYPYMYTPSTWSDGSSLTHWDDNYYPTGNINSLMTHSADDGESNLSPGPVTLGALQDLGWIVNRLIDFEWPAAGSTVYKGINDIISWHDNKGGTITLKLYKKNSNGEFVEDAQIYSGTSVKGWNRPAYNYDAAPGVYIIRALKDSEGFGDSFEFTIANPKVNTPFANPSAGFPIFYPDTIYFYCSTPGAKIGIKVSSTAITQDVTEPSVNVPFYIVTSGGPLYIRLRAFKDGFSPSDQEDFAYQYYYGHNIVQKGEDGATFGNAFYWDNEWKPVTGKLEYSSPANKFMKAQTDFRAGTNEAFQHWVSDANGRYYRNYESIPIHNDRTTTIANFRKKTSATIRVSIEGTSATSDSIYFKDPWLYEGPSSNMGTQNKGANAIYHSLKSPLTISTSDPTYKGIFKNIIRSTYGLTYQIKMKNSYSYLLNNRIYPCYFQNWNLTNASLTTPNALESDVIFTDDNAKVEAVYKGHMLTSNIKGFSPSGQRKFLYINNSLGYVVYESMDKIWMCKGTNIGKSNATFGNEILVSENADYYDGIVKAKNVCIAKSDEGSNYLYVVYQGASYDGTTGPLIFKVYFGETCIFRTTIEEDLPYSNDAKPTIATRSTTLSIVYKPSALTGLKEIGYVKNSNPSWNYWYDNTLDFTDQNSINPSVVYSYPLNSYCIVFQNSNTEVKYAEYNSNVADYITTLSASSGFTYNYNPGIRLTNIGYPLVYWAARTMYPSILIKKKSAQGANGWSTTFSTGGYSDEPAVGAALMYDAAVFAWYNSYYQQLWYIKRWPANYPSTGYSPVKYLSVTATPQLSDGLEMDSIKGVYFFNTSSGPVYTMDNWNYNFRRDAVYKESDVSTTYGRSIVVNKKGVENVFYLGDIKVNDEDIMLATRPDSLPVNTAEEATKAMTTEEFNLVGGEKIELRFYNYCIRKELKDSLKADDYVQFRLEAVNKQNGLKAELHKVKFNKDNLSDSTEQVVTVNTDNLKAGTYEFRAAVEVKGEGTFSLMNHQNALIGDRLFKKDNYDLTAEMQLPSVYALSQNYPNPFNPSTIINYDLPGDSRVTLKVYDILGREITTLVNEYKQAGRYNVTFNASYLATGIYIYELRANDYVSVKKMSFVK